jgi:hypothetical protein
MTTIFEYNNNKEIGDQLKQAFRHGIESAEASSQQQQQQIERLGTDKNGDLWVRSFLINDKVNARGWSVDKSTLDKNVYSIVGRPLVIRTDPVTGRNDHPVWDTLKPADANFKEQSKYKIGTVEHVFYDENTDSYYADSRIDNKGAKDFINSFTSNKIPIPVSPQIVYDPNQEFSNNYKNWIFTHLSVVDKAAYPDAKVIGSCTGDYKTTCGEKLQQIATIPAAAATAASASSSLPSSSSPSLTRIPSVGFGYQAPYNGKRAGHLA